MYSFKNNIKTELATNFTASTTYLACAHLITSDVAADRAAAWPAVGDGAFFNLTIVNNRTKEFEIVKCTSISANWTNFIEFTVERAQEDTSAKNFEVSTTSVEHRLTAGSLNNFIQDIDLADTTTPGISRIATLADMESGSVIENGPAVLAAGSEAVTTTPTPYAVPQAGEDGEIWGLAKRDMNNLTKTGTTAIAHYASPSVSGKIAVSGPATSGGKTVPMPSSGWLQGYGPSSSVGGNISLQTYSQVQQSTSAPNVGYSCFCSIDVAKGEQVTVAWYGMSSVTLFFTPDKGAN